MHVAYEGALAKTLPAPTDADRRATLRGARLTAEQRPVACFGAKIHATKP